MPRLPDYGASFSGCQTRFPSPPRNKLSRTPAGVRRLSILARGGFRCCYCKSDISSIAAPPKNGYITVDHVKPLARGGASSDSNLVACCNSCNRLKSDRSLSSFCAMAGLNYNTVKARVRREVKRDRRPFLRVLPMLNRHTLAAIDVAKANAAQAFADAVSAFGFPR